jgi:hypothetical protein
MTENMKYNIKNLKLGLDKLTLTVTPPDMTPYGDVVKGLKEMAIHGQDMTFAVPGARAGYRFAARLKISSAPPDAWPLLQVSPYVKGPFFRLECNPNRLGFDGITQMKDIIDANTHQGWPLFMKCARASRIDVNIDAQGLPLDGVLVCTSYARRTEVWSQKGELEIVGVGVQTIYLGSKERSKEIFRIYRLGSSKIDPDCQVATRFESVDGTKRPLLSQLHDYAFPFGKLVVRSALAPTPPGWTHGFWNMFLDYASNHGLNVALHRLTYKERKQAKKSLAAVPVAGLDLKQAWSQWPSLIESLGIQTPGFDGPYMAGFASMDAAA